jgi:hypothetical protein
MNRSILFGLNLFVALSALVLMSIDGGDCNSPPPCSETPDSIMGDFDGVLYDSDSGGQMYANYSELCANVDDDVYYDTNVDTIQTIVTIEQVNRTDVFAIYIGDFKEPWMWNGGAQILVFYDDALESYRTGQPVVLDGVRAVAYYWTDGFWDGDLPQYVTDSGEIQFTMVSHVSGGPEHADYSGHLVPYVPPEE